MDQSNNQVVESPQTPQTVVTPKQEQVLEAPTPKSSGSVGIKRILVKILLVIAFMGILAVIGTVFCKGNLKGLVGNQ